MRHLFTKDIKNMVIKVGTSVLTKKKRFDKKIVVELCREISKFLDQGIQVCVVSSGAIGAGMTILGLKTRPRSMEELQASAAAGQRYLMQCYEESFSRCGYSTAQVLLTWSDLSERKRFLNAKRTLGTIQKWNLVPIINENDTVATDEIRFGDNDRLSALLSILVEADVLVILSNTNGLYAGGGLGRKVRRIPVVQKMNRSVFSHVRDSDNSFTVGGMRSKLEAIQMSVSSGIPVFLADGRSGRVLTRLFSGNDIGTLFVPALKNRHSRQSWLDFFIHHTSKGARNPRS